MGTMIFRMDFPRFLRSKMSPIRYGRQEGNQKRQLADVSRLGVVCVISGGLFHRPVWDGFPSVFAQQKRSFCERFECTPIRYGRQEGNQKSQLADVSRLKVVCAAGRGIFAESFCLSFPELRTPIPGKIFFSRHTKPQCASIKAACAPPQTSERRIL